MKKSIISAALVLVCIVIAPLTSCSGLPAEEHSRPDDSGLPVVSVEGDGYPLTLHDFLGYETVLENMPERVAVVASATLNIWYDIGGKSLASPDVSANVKLDPQYEDEIRALPSLGPYYAMNIESLVDLHADLYIMQYEMRSLAATLRDMGFKVFITGLKGLSDVEDTYRAFGAILEGKDRAERRISEINAQKDAVTAKLPDTETSVVVLYLTAQSLSVKLNNSIAGDLMNILKLKNIASDLPPDTIGSENTPLDIEYIVASNPDYVFVTSMVSDNDTAINMMNDHFTNNPAWKGVKAIQEGRIIYLPQQYFLVNAGPFYGEAIEYMAKQVYPEIYN